MQHSSPQVSIQNTQLLHLISICVGSRINNTEFVNIHTPLTTKLMTAACKICPAIIKTLYFWLFQPACPYLFSYTTNRTNRAWGSLWSLRSRKRNGVILLIKCSVHTHVSRMFKESII